jgi:hypothetical protein
MYSKENLLTEGGLSHVRGNTTIINEQQPLPQVVVDSQKSSKSRKLELTSSSLNTCKMKQYLNNHSGRIQSPQGGNTQGSLRKTSPEYRSFTSGGDDSVERHHKVNQRNTSVSGSHLDVYNTLSGQISDDHLYV